MCPPQGMSHVAVDVARVVVSWADSSTWSAKLELNIIDVACFSRISSSSFCFWFFSLVSL